MVWEMAYRQTPSRYTQVGWTACVAVIESTWIGTGVPTTAPAWAAPAVQNRPTAAAATRRRVIVSRAIVRLRFSILCGQGRKPALPITHCCGAEAVPDHPGWDCLSPRAAADPPVGVRPTQHGAPAS